MKFSLITLKDLIYQETMNIFKVKFQQGERFYQYEFHQDDEFQQYDELHQSKGSLEVN